MIKCWGRLEKLKIRENKKRMITVNELFAGIGSQTAALERLGIDFKVVGIAEIDKYAIKSYEAIHGPVRNYGDISKIEKLDYADFWTYSFPCQDISVAGKCKGIIKGKTRSGLLYEVERLLENSKEYNELPKYLMLENVKNLVGKKFKPQFDEWLKRLDDLGYNTYWKVLNAKNYGIPQNRERVFAISIRKDIDTGYEFPQGFDNGKRLKDVLESEVDERFYISNERMSILTKNIDMNKVNKNSMIGSSQKHASVKDNGICSSLTSAMGMGGGQTPMVVSFNEINQIGMLDIKGNEQVRRVYSVDGISPTLNTMQGGNRQPKILEYPCIGASRGRNQENPSDRIVGSPTEQRLEINQNGTSNTITTVQKDNYVVEPMIIDPQGRLNKQCTPRNFCPTLRAQTHGNLPQVTYPNTDFRTRKLTPLEVWRLMGFTDEQFNKAEQVNSNSQLYKQAGNSIVVDVLYYLFKNLFDKN